MRLLGAIALSLGALLSQNVHAQCSQFIEGGATFQSKSENGTWYDLAYGTTQFRQLSYGYGFGAKCGSLAAEVQDLGHEYSTYHDQSGTTWSGHQHPRGVWLFWEPTLVNKVYGKIGLGADKPNFTMHAVTKTGGSINASNDHLAPSYALGVGYNFGLISIEGTTRYIYASIPSGPQLTDRVPNLGKFAAAIEARFTF
jgi:hypothetical protein